MCVVGREDGGDQGASRYAQPDDAHQASPGSQVEAAHEPVAGKAAEEIAAGADEVV